MGIFFMQILGSYFFAKTPPLVHDWMSGYVTDFYLKLPWTCFDILLDHFEIIQTIFMIFFQQFIFFYSETHRRKFIGV